MHPELSVFGERFSRRSGALELMDDLGTALSGENAAFMLGGGNPGKIPRMQHIFRERLAAIAADEAEFDRMLSNYAHPAGELRFRRAVARMLSTRFGWPLTADNVALTAGSQAAFFLLFNALAGSRANGGFRRILLPVTPEYVGYANLGLDEGLFTARRPRIQDLGDDFFKYYIDFESVRIDESIAAVCISRPTNPTGNVVTDAELARLDELCRMRGVPLIIDSAYGVPFPGIVFGEATPIWNDNVVLCMSLSKLGLPGARTGIVVAAAPIIETLTSMTAITNLAVGSVGPVLAYSIIDSGEIIDLSRQCIAPYYRAKAERACELLQRELKGLPFKIHRPEGAIFLWLWLPELPIGSGELYGRLKAAGVLVLSGHHFFPGLEQASAWAHTRQCLRLSFAQDDDVVEQGIGLLARELRRVHRL